MDEEERVEEKIAGRKEGKGRRDQKCYRRKQSGKPRRRSLRVTEGDRERKKERQRESQMEGQKYE